MTRLLVITTLYPNRVQFRHGIFVEARLRKLLQTGHHSAVVIAPVPWFPFRSRSFPSYSQYAKVPLEEERNGIRVLHPRYLVIPKIGMSVTPVFLAAAVWRSIRKINRESIDYDIVDAHYFYPDGVAVALLSRFLRRPFLITARGSDINVLPRFAVPRCWIRWAARRASALVTVSDALRTRLLGLGIEGGTVHVVRNGVDLELFAPRDRAACKSRLGVGAKTLVSVGNLIALKGHDLVIRALQLLPGYALLIVGEGELRKPLEELADALRVGDRVRFLGAVRQAELAEIYNAADALVLASSREGMPNVLLEAMACGTPVVATAVGGVPEVVKGEAAGVLVEQRDAGSIAAAVRHLFDAYPAPAATRRYAEAFSWDSAVASLGRLFEEMQAQ